MTVSIIKFPAHSDENGILCVYERAGGVPFEIRRIFTVTAQNGDMRGNHAHKMCTQLLVCVSGEIRVSYDDGLVTENCLLNSLDCGLLIPPGIWAQEEYMSDNAVLMVLCDRDYEVEDYIRDYDEFKKFVELKG